MNKSTAQKIVLIKKRYREGMEAYETGVNIVRATPAAFLSKEIYVEDFAFVKRDESVVRDTLQRLTYASRVDHSPPVENWAIEELLFRLDHLEELSKGQVEALHRVNRWIALGDKDDPETWG